MFWSAAFRLLYRILAFLDPLIRGVWRRNGIGNVVEIEVPRRSGTGSRRRLIGLLHAGDSTYVGHPSGAAGWTRDLAAATDAVVRFHDGTEWPVRAHELPRDEERESAIRATGQHPFPGNLVYRLGRRHVRSAGVFFRLTDRA